MIVQETYELGGRQFVRTYSDAGRYVVGGDPPGAYAEANDPAELGRTYVEGELMPTDERTDIADKAEAYDILMGVSE
jgi:hypothetical protein